MLRRSSIGNAIAHPLKIHGIGLATCTYTCDRITMCRPSCSDHTPEHADVGNGHHSTLDSSSLTGNHTLLFRENPSTTNEIHGGGPR